jgi:hypothetical protein
MSVTLDVQLSFFCVSKYLLFLVTNNKKAKMADGYDRPLIHYSRVQT